MTYYANTPSTKHPQSEKCSHCGHEFLIGITGAVDGCDECLGIFRNLDGMIIEQRFHFVEDVDELTDMEMA